MKTRRKFIKQLAAASIAGSMVVPSKLLSQKKAVKKDNWNMKMASWCHIWGFDNPADFTGSDAHVKRQMDNVVKAGIDILFPFVQTNDVFDKVYYQSSIDNVESEDRLSRLVRVAMERNVQVHPIVQLVCELGISKEEQMRRRYRSGDDINPDDVRPCASWRKSLEGGLEIIQDILNNHTVDGIHMDYIRYVDNRSGQALREPCRCEECTSRYRHLLGKETLSADDLEEPGVLYKYLQFRGENMRWGAEQSHEIVHEAGLPISMAARSNYLGRALVEGQDWVQWARDGLMDFISPMNYAPTREDHRSVLAYQMSLIGKSVPVYSGIGRIWSGGENTTATMIQQAEDALELGASGISVFRFGNLDDHDFRELGAFKRANM